MCVTLFLLRRIPWFFKTMDECEVISASADAKALADKSEGLKLFGLKIPRASNRGASIFVYVCSPPV